MPGRNVTKKYKRNRYYHLYNRGVNKETILFTKVDYERFIKYLDDAIKRYDLKLIKYALMPNHFHLLVRQRRTRDIEKLMRSLSTRYVLYVNNKYERVGSLFQGPYRARLIKNEDDLLSVSGYIERHSGNEEALGETLF